MNALELAKADEATDKGIEASEFLIKFGTMMESVETIKYQIPLLSHFPENEIDYIIGNMATKVMNLSKEFKENKKYQPFTDFLRDYFVDSSIKAKNNWREKRR